LDRSEKTNHSRCCQSVFVESALFASANCVSPNKNKPDELKDKVLFINADREFAEGKNQNKLRPEDIEKIDYVFTNKIEIPKYSRLVELNEIGKNDFNLNIRRYVDNTPDPEPEDVKAHLLGGVPKTEIESYAPILAKFNFDTNNIFTAKSESYENFCPEIEEKSQIKNLTESDQAVMQVFRRMNSEITEWWELARDDFSKLENSNIMPQVRAELMYSIKERIIPIGVFDDFQTAGIFVNWWQIINADLKTIMNSGWETSLIPDEYIINSFFTAETEEIENLESALNEAEAALSEAVEDAEFEADDEESDAENVSLSQQKSYLKTQIKELKELKTESATAEREKLEEQLEEIEKCERRIRELKTELRTKQAALQRKVDIKRDGIDEEKEDTQEFIDQIKDEIEELSNSLTADDAAEKKRQKEITALVNDKETQEAKIVRLENELAEIGGQITAQQAKELILEKLFDFINNELQRYLNAEKRALIFVFEKLWDKYAVSARMIEQEREATINELDSFLTKLGYLNEEFAKAQV
jgi:type I restriction enzyme M protein